MPLAHGTGSFWTDRPTLITGATGFLGGHLTRHLLEQGASIVALVCDWNPSSTFIREGLWKRVRMIHGDLSSLAHLTRLLGEHEIEVVFHLAAQTIVSIANRNPLSTFTTNIQGTWNLLEAARLSPLIKSMVVASSDKAYGASPILPYTEATPLNPRFPYDVSKACADMITRSYSTTFGLPACVTRCGNFYGGGDLNWSRIIPNTIRRLTRGEAPILKGNGDGLRDYFYIEDGAMAYAHLAQHLFHAPDALRGKAFNFSSGSCLTSREVVEHIRPFFPFPPSPITLKTDGMEIPSQSLDITLSQTLLGWSPHFPFEEGITRTVAWYKEFLA